MIELVQVTQTYRTPAKTIHALEAITVTVQAGEFVVITGPSGSGKTTLLYLLAGLDRPVAGEVTVAGTRLNTLNENQLARWRARQVGVVFQFYQLLPTLTVLENVLFPMELGALASWPKRRQRAASLLAQVGLAERAAAFPAELSGGEQQRVAIARALANDPPLILADEPTGNLDSATGQAIWDVFASISGQGRTLVVVTHNRDLAGQAGRALHLVDGRLTSANA